METIKRTIIKTISWRVWATVLSFVVSYIFTGNISLSGGIAAGTLVSHTLAYYLHERVWNSIKWGRK